MRSPDVSKKTMHTFFKFNSIDIRVKYIISPQRGAATSQGRQNQWSNTIKLFSPSYLEFPFGHEFLGNKSSKLDLLHTSTTRRLFTLQISWLQSWMFIIRKNFDSKCIRGGTLKEYVFMLCIHFKLSRNASKSARVYIKENETG